MVGVPKDEVGHQRGAALVGVSLVLALVMMSALVLGGVAQRSLWRARAQSAADAAALAGVAGGEAEAAALAERNGAVLISFTGGGNEVEVRVDYRGTPAVARAERRLEPAVEGCPSLPCSGP